MLLAFSLGLCGCVFEAWDASLYFGSGMKKIELSLDGEDQESHRPSIRTAF
jgi:hypothetical protein